MAGTRGPDEHGLAVRAVRTLQLVRVLTPRELRIRYRQSVLNALWAVVGPVAVLVIYGIVLTQSFGVTGSCSSYLTSAWAGLVIWTFFASAVGSACIALVSSADLISKLYFPREALPLAAVGAALVELTVGTVVLLGLVVFHEDGLTTMAVTALLPVLVIIVWASAVSIFVAALAAFTRDVVHGVSIFLRVGFFASAIMYEADDIPSAFAWTTDANPVTVAATGVRDAVLCGTSPPIGLLTIHLALGLAALVAAVLYMRSVESRIVDVV